MIKKLTQDAQDWCKIRNITDENLKETIKELKVCLRLDHDVKYSEYKKWNDSLVIEKMMKFRKEEIIGGAVFVTGLRYDEY